MKVTTVRIVSLCLTLLLVSCARRTTGDKDIPLVWISHGPSYNFGTASLINTYIIPVAVTNVGRTNATALEAQFASSNDIGFLGGTYPGTAGTCGDTITPVSACVLVLAYSPTASGSVNNTLRISFNDGQKDWNVERVFSGTAQAPQWTWVSGSNGPSEVGSYGTQGTASGTNVPGARQGSIGWADIDSNLWLFGGFGFHTGGPAAYLNDLWKFDGTNWTWMGGTQLGNQLGIYGEQSVSAGTNQPGARSESAAASSVMGAAYLFGGTGYGEVGAGVLNDLWSWNGSQWTWLDGTKVANGSGVYGSLGVANAVNVPGGRSQSSAFLDVSGRPWVLAGTGYDKDGVSGYLNDLWKWDGTDWTWMSGDNVVLIDGIYGSLGVSNPANKPGAHSLHRSWVDVLGNFWIFGGYGRDKDGATGFLNHLFKWDGNNWTWMSGGNTVDQNGVYGTLGVASAANTPGAHARSCSFRDPRGRLWFFGGEGRGSVGVEGFTNDLWMYDGQWRWVSGASSTGAAGSYGTKGQANDTNIPPARKSHQCWVDFRGNLWVFGGTGAGGSLNDLWKYGG